MVWIKSYVFPNGDFPWYANIKGNETFWAHISSSFYWFSKADRCSSYLLLHNIASSNLVAYVVKAVSFLCEICNLGSTQWRQFTSAPCGTNWGHSNEAGGPTHKHSSLTWLDSWCWELSGGCWPTSLFPFPMGLLTGAPWASSHHGSWILRVSGQGGQVRCCKSSYISPRMSHSVISLHSTKLSK